MSRPCEIPGRPLREDSSAEGRSWRVRERLADVGVKGNGHMLMLEKNNMEIAAVAQKWLRENVKRERTARR